MLRVQRRQFREVGALSGLPRIESVDQVDLCQRRVPLACFARRGWLRGAGDLVAPAQPVLPDLGEGEGGVGRPALVAPAADECPAVGDVEETRNRDRRGVLGRGGARGGLGVPGLGVPGPAGIPGPPGVLAGRASGAGSVSAASAPRGLSVTVVIRGIPFVQHPE